MKSYFGLRDYGTATWSGGDAACDHKKVTDPIHAVATSTLDGGKKTTGHQQEGFGKECRRCGAVRIDKQIGLEPTLAEFIAVMVRVFADVRRVLRDDGVLFLNMGDSYHTDSPVRSKSSEAFSETWDAGQTASRGGLRKSAAKSGTLKNKDLMMVPARLAIALQDDGWWLRSDIIWAKQNPMPESVTDRPTSSHEHIFLLTKSARYYWDQDAVREEVTGGTHARGNKKSPPKTMEHESSAEKVKNNQSFMEATWGTVTSRNMRNVWTINPQPYPESHFATFPPEIPRRCIKAGTSEHGCCAACGAPWKRQLTEKHYGDWEKDRDRMTKGRTKPSGQKAWDAYEAPQETGWAATCECDAEVVPCTVLDPFVGSGTTLMVADQLGRNGIGIELNPEYAEMARRRIYGDSPLFVEVTVE